LMNYPAWYIHSLHLMAMLSPFHGAIVHHRRNNAMRAGLEDDVHCTADILALLSVSPAKAGIQSSTTV
jgi:hypothetical protein